MRPASKLAVRMGAALEFDLEILIYLPSGRSQRCKDFASDTCLVYYRMTFLFILNYFSSLVAS